MFCFIACNCPTQYSKATDFLYECDDSGQCSCIKQTIVGKKCDECLDSHWKFPHCDICDCNATNTIDNSIVCNKSTGKCNCKPGYGGRTCNECESGYYNFQSLNPLW